MEKERHLPVTLHNEAGIAVLRLAESVDITVAAELKRLLLEAFQSSTETCIDLSQATAIDVTAVQLLWAAGRHARSNGKILHAVPPKDELIVASLREVGVDLPTWESEPARAGEQH